MAAALIGFFEQEEWSAIRFLRSEGVKTGES
jgi:hypothetical protein